MKQLIIELRNRCSGLHSPSGPPNSGGVDTRIESNKWELTSPSVSPDQ